MNSLIRGVFGRHFLPQIVATFPLLALILVAAAVPARAQESWSTVGPDGGDARSFAAVPGDPNHLYLGTTDSWIYESTDGGASWHRLAKMAGSNAFVLDHIVVDPTAPATIYAAAWRADGPGGGLWITHDGGRSWNEVSGMHGQSVFAFAQAPSDPHILFAGTLQGVFRSNDGGATWTEISPEGSREIHEVESLAIDPANPDILYAGTWHLPWKTDDGGKTWHNIKQGLIVDSDVFSIIIDPDRIRTVYLSACSGIYKSENAGALFHKIHGIPNEARRTRVLMQDPENREVVYAGTTEGLYKTLNGGRTFTRLTDASVIVNDVFVDPRDSKHVLLATDRGGVLASHDGGETFAASNTGISERKVEALLVDRSNAQRLYAGVVNDKSYGGVFVSSNGGKSWSQSGHGLDGRDVYVLAQTTDGTVLAGTNSGIFALDPPADGAAAAPVWEARNTIANTVTKTVTETHFKTRVNVEKQEKSPVVELDGRVAALDVSSDVWAAATSSGLLTSRDKGATWQGGPVMGTSSYLSVTVHGDDIAAARADGVVLSEDKGLTWWPLGVPKMLTRIHGVAFSPDGTLWLGAREGVYFTKDMGKSWMWIERLPFRDVDDLSYDARLKRVLVSSRSNDEVFAIDPKTLTWDWWQTGYPVSLIRAAGERLVAASLNDGVLLEPPAAGTLPPQRASLHTGH
jgi:photosystem II stability/assembly factor-like uncharacterized protein